MIWNSNSLSRALGTKVPIGLQAKGIKFNSLEIVKGDLFIALPGKRDSHDYVDDAFARGAVCAIVSKDMKDIDPNVLIQVEDTLLALNLLAEYKRRTVNAKFIAITGSVGKTTTKEIISLMLSAYGKTHASCKSYNNFLGVPLTLASMPDNTDYAVIEMGMNAPGELSHLSNMVIPNVAIITTISEGHIGFFKSLEEIADAKCEIFEGVDINTGVAIVNRDISTYERCIENIDRACLRNVQTFGTRVDANVRFLGYELLENNFARLQFSVDYEEYELVMPNISMHLASNFSIGFAVIKAFHLDMDTAIDAIKSFQPLIGRGKLVEVDYKEGNLRIITDYYNSNPQSLKSALEYLKQFDSQNKVAVIGDMGELGDREKDLHLSVVPSIIESGITKLYLVGKVISVIKNEIPKEIKVNIYDNIDELILENDANFDQGDLILIKGSRSIAMEKLAKSLGIKNAL